MQATGTFQVKMEPLVPYTQGDETIKLGRMSLDKTYQGDLEATAQGEMLMVNTAVPESAGYVAVERVSGTLHGKTGAFALQHFGVMHGGDNRLLLEIVPGSGSGDLAGIAGTLAIAIKDGRHHYQLTYTLPTA